MVHQIVAWSIPQQGAQRTENAGFGQLGICDDCIQLRSYMISNDKMINQKIIGKPSASQPKA